MRRGALYIAVAAGFVMVSAAAYIVYSQSQHYNPAVGGVLVSGTLHWPPVGSGPSIVTFTDESGSIATAQLNESHHNSTGGFYTYSVMLKNNHSYSVSVKYRIVVPGQPAGVCQAPTLDLSTAAKTYTFNISSCR